jgi:SAM-dependent methyltransferase
MMAASSPPVLGAGRDGQAQSVRCRNCGASADTVFCDLGISPPSNAYLTLEELNEPESRYPLRPMICVQCGLVQLPEVISPGAIFSEYAYFSSQSASWVQHCDDYVKMAVERFSLGQGSRVIELASNDGALLASLRRQGVPAFGIEPAENIANYANLRGLATISKFFGTALARELLADGCQADLVVANNVMAHVPDLRDFIAGIQLVLGREGVLTVEVPDLECLIAENQFDTIYHEHFSYFSLGSLTDALSRAGLRVFDVECLPTHGGSLRVYACHEDGPHTTTGASAPEPSRERLADYAPRPQRFKFALLSMLTDLKLQGKSIAAYSAPAKGNTLLNYCGITRDFIDCAYDSTPAKQGLFLPGSRIPIYAPELLPEHRPDVIFVLAWNWLEEIKSKLTEVSDWNAQIISRLDVDQLLA